MRSVWIPWHLGTAALLLSAIFLPLGCLGEDAAQSNAKTHVNVIDTLPPEILDSPLALLPGSPYDPETYGMAPGDSEDRLILPPDGIFSITTTPGPDWLSQIGGIGTESIFGVAMAPNQAELYAAGNTFGGLPGGTGTLPAVGALGANDIFLRQYTPAGSLNWSRQLGGTAATTREYATGVAICNQSQDIYVVGYTNGILPPGVEQPATPMNANMGAYDAFLAKFDRTGMLLWTRLLGTSGNDYGWSVATEPIVGHPDANGDVYIVGGTTGVIPGGIAQPMPANTNSGLDDIFIAKFAEDGTLLWTREAGTPGNDAGQGVTVDRDTNVYVGGYVSAALSGVTPLGPKTGVHAGAKDAVLLKYNGLGTLMDFYQHGSSQDDQGMAVASSTKMGALTRVYMAGITRGSLFGTNLGAYDYFIRQYNNNQGGIAAGAMDLSLGLSHQGGTAGNDYTYGVDVDGLANVYVAGQTNYQIVSNVPNTPMAGGLDAFSRKWDANLNLITTNQLDSNNPVHTDGGRAIAADYQNGVYLGGFTRGAFAPNTNAGGDDGLLAKYLDGCTFNGPNTLCATGWGCGDPHLRTLDGIYYDFQGCGEFVLIESLPGDPNPLAIQVRQRATSPNSPVAVYSAVATQIGGDRIAFYADQSPPLRIQGMPTTLALGASLRLPGGGAVHVAKSNTYNISWPSGELLQVVTGGSHLNVYMAVPTDRKGTLRGLLGTYDAINSNEFTLRDGTPMPPSLTFQQLYKDPVNFANSYRISQGESLFDYGMGQDTTTFTDLNCPGPTPFYKGNLTAQQQADGELACQAVGIQDPTMLNACILDVGLTGDPTLAQGLADVETQDEIVGAAPPVVLSQGIYFHALESNPGAEWIPSALTSSPDGTRHMLGEFGPGNVTLHLGTLPAHTYVSLSFDVVVIGGWDGEGPMGPHYFTVTDDQAGGLVETTFSNTGSLQSYPGTYPSGNPAGAGASEVGTLGYPNGDSVYRLSFSYPHTGSDIVLNFGADGLTGIYGEAWALDNVDVSVGTNP